MSLQHYDENTSIHFKDIPSGKEEFLEAKENLDRLLRHSPCDSNCRLKISAVKGGFRGILEVNSKDKIFRIEHKSNSIKDLQKFLFTQMNEDLDQWKKERSEKDITGTVKLESLVLEKRKAPRK